MDKFLRLTFSVFFACVLFISCKKESHNEIIEPPKLTKADTLNLLKGFWKSSPQNGYFTLEIKNADYIIDYSNANFKLFTGKLELKDDSLFFYNQDGFYINGAFKIKKLTADSLIFANETFTFKHYRSTKVVSLYDIVTIGGNGSGAYFFNEGIPALTSPIGHPTSITQDKEGNIYLTSILSTSIMVIDCNTYYINSLDNKLNIKGFFQSVFIADDGELYFSDRFNLYKYNFDLKSVIKINKSLDWGDITDIVVDKNKNIYISTAEDRFVRKIDGVTGDVTKIIGADNFIKFNPSPSSPFDVYFIPQQMTLDKDGNLLITDPSDNCIWKYDTLLHSIKLFAGTGKSDFSGDGELASLATFNMPTGIAIDKIGNVFVADSHNFRVRKIDVNGIITTIAGRDYGFDKDGNATDSSMIPGRLSVNSEGEIILTDLKNFRLKKLVLR
ncbi:hypothetical protein GWR56_17040 [Mucilaginibacter sp. 14171R-50]|uniref:NHL domain-containing protein n=1 Tax=Mucilaginibacter sp. 14171R-50 TaxID=2703789 RepID=UPI00138D9ECA|nr:SMP-30/gluconolactonase/LRE family protein [Mucilaginibacter sp. 14171R-50]QHS57160.1 hypothetical protein GWR56_17040 [Mucilaginibacter sp. 14171R-50]